MSADPVVTLCERVRDGGCTFSDEDRLASALLVAWEALGKHVTYHNVREARAEIRAIVKGRE